MADSPTPTQTLDKGIPSVLTNFNVKINTGTSDASETYLGIAEEITLPVLNRKTGEINFASGAMTVDLGQEPLSASFVLTEFKEAVVKKWASANHKAVKLTFYGAATQNTTGIVTKIVITLNGRLTEIDMGTIEQGEIHKMSVEMAVDHYKYQQGSSATADDSLPVLIELDPINTIENIAPEGETKSNVTFREALGL